MDLEKNGSLDRELALVKRKEDELKSAIAAKDEEIELLKGEKASLADQVAYLEKQMEEQRLHLENKAEKLSSK